MTSMQVKQGWKKVNLSEIAREFREPYSPNIDKDIPYLGLEHIEKNTLHIQSIGSSSDTKSTKLRFKTNDILFGKMRPYFRKIVRPKFDGVCSSEISVIRALEKNDQNFIFYLVANNEFVDKISQTTQGTGMPRAKWEVMSKTKVKIPSPGVQQKIASILSAFDDLIENNTKRIKILENTDQLIYKEWFVNFKFPGHEKMKMVDSGTEFGKIPEGWEVKRVGEVADYIARGIAPKYDEAGDCLVINQRCIRNNHIDISLARRNSKKINELKAILLGDVLINSTGVGTLGRVSQVYENYGTCTVDSHVTIVRPSACINMDYLGLSLFNLESTFEALGAGSTGQTELSRKSVEGVEMLSPPFELQKRFSETVSPSRKQIVLANNRNRHLSQTRDLLLPRLVGGEVEVD